MNAQVETWQRDFCDNLAIPTLSWHPLPNHSPSASKDGPAETPSLPCKRCLKSQWQGLISSPCHCQCLEKAPLRMLPQRSQIMLSIICPARDFSNLNIRVCLASRHHCQGLHATTATRCLPGHLDMESQSGCYIWKQHLNNLIYRYIKIQNLTVE